eukprot:6480304-Amphidinium_carterae.1
MSWYNPEFDVNDPIPDVRESESSTSKWPIDPDRQLWKFMMKLNEAHLNHFYHGTVISMSHFLPRRDLPFAPYNKAAWASVTDFKEGEGIEAAKVGHAEGFDCKSNDNRKCANICRGTSASLQGVCAQAPSWTTKLLTKMPSSICLPHVDGSDHVTRQ